MKLSSSLNAINSFRNRFPTELPMKLYYSFFYYHVTYGILLLSSDAKCHLNSVEQCKRKYNTCTCIAGVNTYAHTGNRFSRYKISKIGDIYKLHLGEYMYSQIHTISLLLACFTTKETMMSTHTIYVKLIKYIIYITAWASKLLAFSTLRQNIMTLYEMK